jgi:hypothetical protein
MTNTMAVCGIFRASRPSANVVAADGVNDRAGAEEQQRLENAVREQMQKARGRESAPMAVIM